jgi:hypothetical protein
MLQKGKHNMSNKNIGCELLSVLTGLSGVCSVGEHRQNDYEAKIRKNYVSNNATTSTADDSARAFYTEGRSNCGPG